MKTAIAIPARYGSSRFPGKPLAVIDGKTMLQRVVELAQNVAADIPDTTVFITTEDQRIAQHATELGTLCIITPPSCATGSDRVLSALRQLKEEPDFVVNLQGDAPFTPPAVLKSLITTFQQNPQIEVITPVTALGWAALDRLREAKKTTPFSGTTAIINNENQALWFSKNIIPALRNEDELRKNNKISPIYQHIGLYGYRPDILERFCTLPQGHYERLEGLEQLRFLENGIRITAVKVDIDQDAIQSGIDTPDDLARAEARLKAAS